MIVSKYAVSTLVHNFSNLPLKSVQLTSNTVGGSGQAAGPLPRDVQLEALARLLVHCPGMYSWRLWPGCWSTAQGCTVGGSGQAAGPLPRDVQLEALARLLVHCPGMYSWRLSPGCWSTAQGCTVDLAPSAMPPNLLQDMPAI